MEKMIDHQYRKNSARNIYSNCNQISDILIILQQAKKSSSKSTVETTIKSSAFTIKLPAAKLPLITSDMTHPQFRKFRINEVIKDIPREVKCVDDTLSYDSSIEESYHT